MLDDLSSHRSPRFKAEHSSWMYCTYTLERIWWQLQFLSHWFTTSGVWWGTSDSFQTSWGTRDHTCIISDHPLGRPRCLTLHMTSGYLHGSTFCPHWMWTGWMFISWTCGWRRNKLWVTQQAHSGPQRMGIFLFHTKNIRVFHAAEAWTLTGEMRALSLTYKNAQG